MEISVVIITYNEEDRLESALKSVTDIASEIIVVDSNSQDDTVKVAKKYTDQIFNRDWTNYANQKNFGNSKASYPWILSLDADERLSPELKAEILALKETDPEVAAFSMPRQAFYMGKWIRHSGWYPDRKIRLFQKDLCLWEGEYVHETLAVDGKIQKLDGRIHHFTYRDVKDHVARLNRYSSLSAQNLYAQQRKCHWYHLVFMPIFGFLRPYMYKAGFLDGFAGFVIAALHGYGVFIRYAKLKEIWKKGERIEPFPN